MATTLQALYRYLDSLQERAPLSDLVAELSELKLDCDEVDDFILFSDKNYQRNLMRASSLYHVWVMCWKNGQRSPIHDHSSSSCAVRVLRGALTETSFVFAPNGQIKAVGSRDLHQGQVCGTQEKDLHQISNLQAGAADLITLHVYSRPLVRMGTFSLIDALRSEDIWQLDFSDAAGI